MPSGYFAAAIFAGTVAMPALGSPFDGDNCRLALPPAAAGDDIIFGSIAKIYPRVKDFPFRYTGCQVIWVQEDKGWNVRSIAYFESGDAVSFWRPPPEEMLCQYRSEKIVSGPEQKCPPYEALEAKSTAPGCVNRMLNRGDTKGCKYE